MPTFAVKTTSEGHPVHHTPEYRRPHNPVGVRRAACLSVVVSASMGLGGLLRPLHNVCWGTHERPTCLAAERGSATPAELAATPTNA
ncbi:MAG: hypothetical protein LC777_04270 [Actinobacteria bacterium]|nr:hypothetical protein [Actinomycetota bacterium]